jgi:predicted TIM-barrel fold metal-dependent hydrolase
MTTQHQRIDFHHHFLPPQFIAWLAQQGAKWTGGPPIPDWNIDMAHEVMARNGIAQAVGSVVPGVYWGDTAAAIHWARHANEFSARIVHDDPKRFGAFASMPLPDTHAACRELEYALDVLKLDGVMLMSSVGVQYPGDPDFEEFFAELDKRKAVVFLHPSTVVPGSIVPKLDIPWGVAEFVFDTTRALANLIFSGTMERYPNIKFIAAHAGGTIPYFAMRLQLSGMELPGLADRAPKGVMHYLRKLYVDTALSTHDATMAAVKYLLPAENVVFGSDWPMVPETAVQFETKFLDSSGVLDAAQRQRIDRDNGLALIPRFAQA